MLGAMLAVAGMVLPLGGAAQAAPDYTKVQGPDECAECHKKEVEAWKQSHHFKTFTELPRAEEAQKISDKLGLKRIKTESVCLDCHFTSQERSGKARPIAGITCESCHSAAKDWLKRHGEFSGKKKETETEAERQQRWADAEAAGMIRPSMIYELAKNCYGCHVVPKEELVNKGGHAAGSAFELVSWSQGEIRHNTWHNDGKENREADPNRKRMMYAVGTMVELETALRAVGEATTSAKYAVAMAKRAHAARKKVREVARATELPELVEALRAAHSAGLKLNNGAALSAAADGVGAAAKAFASKYDGSQLASIDSLIPGADKYKGTVVVP
jgi:hypothetical protein